MKIKILTTDLIDAVNKLPSDADLRPLYVEFEGKEPFNKQWVRGIGHSMTEEEVAEKLKGGEMFEVK